MAGDWRDNVVGRGQRNAGTAIHLIVELKPTGYPAVRVSRCGLLRHWPGVAIHYTDAPVTCGKCIAYTARSEPTHPSKEGPE